MQHLERFVIVMYSNGCSAAGVNAARHLLFTTGSKLLEKFTPTQATLFQHTERALLQVDVYWHQTTSVQQEISDLSEFGCHIDGTSA
jgi:hypothetical protein